MMGSRDIAESTKSYSFKRHIKKTKNITEERWIKRIHYYHYRPCLFEDLI
jgi:hypothetical protein